MIVRDKPVRNGPVHLILPQLHDNLPGVDHVGLGGDHAEPDPAQVPEVEHVVELGGNRITTRPDKELLPWRGWGGAGAWCSATAPG